MKCPNCNSLECSVNVEVAVIDNINFTINENDMLKIASKGSSGISKIEHRVFFICKECGHKTNNIISEGHSFECDEDLILNQIDSHLKTMSYKRYQIRNIRKTEAHEKIAKFLNKKPNELEIYKFLVKLNDEERKIFDDIINERF